MPLKHLVTSLIVAALALPACGKSDCETVFDAEEHAHDALQACSEYAEQFGPWYPERFICEAANAAFGGDCRDAKLAEADCLMKLPDCKPDKEDEFEANEQACRKLSNACTDED